MTPKIVASKPSESDSNTIVYCDLDDPDATNFYVRYWDYHWVELECKNIIQAKRIIGIFNSGVEFGKRLKMQEIQKIFGIHTHDGDR